MKNKEYIKQFFVIINILLALVILGTIFYRRVIYKRLGLEAFPEEISSAYVFLFIFIALLCLRKLYIYYKIIYNLPLSFIITNKYYVRLLVFLSKIFVRPFVYLHEFLVSNINMFTVIIGGLTRLAIYLDKKIRKIFGGALILVLIYIPKVMVGGSLIVDVIIYNQLKYVYLFIPLLILPLIARLLLACMFDFCDRNRKTFEPLINSKKGPDDYTIFSLSDEGLKLHEKGEIDFPYLVEQYVYFIVTGYLLIGGYIIKYEEQRTYMNIIYILSIFVCCVYVLYYYY